MKIAVGAALVLLAALVLASLKAATDLVAASTLLTTLTILAVALLGFPRRSWIGFAALGFGYLALSQWYPRALPTAVLFSRSYSYFDPPQIAGLDDLVAMRFEEETPLGDVLNHISETTNLQFYFEPEDGLGDVPMRARKVSINLGYLPLRETLPLVLGQLDLTYSVCDDYIKIEFDHRDSHFYTIARCWTALIFAVVGALAGRRIDMHFKTEGRE